MHYQWRVVFQSQDFLRVDINQLSNTPLPRRRNGGSYSWLVALKYCIIIFSAVPQLSSSSADQLFEYVFFSPVIYCILCYKALQKLRTGGGGQDRAGGPPPLGQALADRREEETLDAMLFQDMIWHVVIDMIDIQIMMRLTTTGTLESSSSGAERGLDSEMAIIAERYPERAEMIKTVAGVFVFLGLFFHQQSFPSVAYSSSSAGADHWRKRQPASATPARTTQHSGSSSLGRLTSVILRPTMIMKQLGGRTSVAESELSVQTSSTAGGSDAARAAAEEKAHHRRHRGHAYKVDVVKARKRSAIVSILLVDVPFFAVRTSVYSIVLLSPRSEEALQSTTVVVIDGNATVPEDDNTTVLEDNTTTTTTTAASADVQQETWKVRSSRLPSPDIWWVKNLVFIVLQAMQLRFVQQADLERSRDLVLLTKSAVGAGGKRYRMKRTHDESLKKVWLSIDQERTESQGALQPREPEALGASPEPSPTAAAQADLPLSEFPGRRGSALARGTVGAFAPDADLRRGRSERAAAALGTGRATGLAVRRAVGRAAGHAVGLAVGLAAGLVARLAVGPAAGLAVGLASGLAVGLAVRLAARLAVGLAVGLAGGLAAGLSVGLAVRLAAGLAVGLAVGLARGRVARLAEGRAEGRAASRSGGAGHRAPPPPEEPAAAAAAAALARGASGGGRSGGAAAAAAAVVAPPPPPGHRALSEGQAAAAAAAAAAGQATSAVPAAPAAPLAPAAQAAPAGAHRRPPSPGQAAGRGQQQQGGASAEANAAGKPKLRPMATIMSVGSTYTRSTTGLSFSRSSRPADLDDLDDQDEEQEVRCASARRLAGRICCCCQRRSQGGARCFCFTCDCSLWAPRTACEPWCLAAAVPEMAGLWINLEPDSDALERVALRPGTLLQVGVLDDSWASQGSELVCNGRAWRPTGGGVLVEVQHIAASDACFEWYASAVGEASARGANTLLHICAVAARECRVVGQDGYPLEHVNLAREVTEDEASALCVQWGSDGALERARLAMAQRADGGAEGDRGEGAAVPEPEGMGDEDEDDGEHLEPGPEELAGPTLLASRARVGGPVRARGQRRAASPAAARHPLGARRRLGGRGAVAVAAQVEASTLSARSSKARTTAIKDGDWYTAKWMALIPTDAQPSAASRDEEAAARRVAHAKLKCEELREKLLANKPRFFGLGREESPGRASPPAGHLRAPSPRTVVGGSPASLSMIATSGREAGPSPVRKVLAAAVGNGRSPASLRAKGVSRSPSTSRAAAGATGSQSREVRLGEGTPQIPTFKELRAANARGPQETKSAYKARLMTILQRAKSKSLQSSPLATEALLKRGEPLRDRGALVDKGCHDAIEWAIIAGLNFEAEGRAAGAPRAWPQIASQVQQVALVNISCAAAYFAKDALEPLSDLDIDKLIKTKGIGYSGQELLPGLPKPGLAGSVQALDLAAPHVQESLLDPTRLLKPQDKWPEEVPKASVQVASDDEWYALCKHLIEAGIFEPVEDRGICQVGGKQVFAGAFAVAKSGAPTPPFTRVTRLIINMVPQNAYQRIAETDLDTLTPSSTWASIVVPDGQALLWSSDDQSGAFHLHALPRAWRGYTALRKPVPGSLEGRPQLKWVKMAVAVTPMGWLSAVSLFQHLHRRLGIGDGPRSAGFDKKVERRRDRPLPLVPQAKAQARVQHYLDDFDSPEIVPESVATLIEGTISDFQERQRRAYSSARVPWSDKKAVCRQRRLVRMGALVDGDAGRVGVTIDNLMGIGQMIMWLLAGKEKVTAKACLMVLGRLARAFEFRRPLFATLNEARQDVRLPEGARTELLAALCLLPMAFTSIRATFDPVVLATDASEEGGGLCYSTGLTKHGAEVAGADPGEEGLAFLSRGAMSSVVPPELLPRGVPLPTVALFDFFGGIGAAMGRHARFLGDRQCGKEVRQAAMARGDRAGDITKLAPESLEKVARSAAEVASCAIAGGGSPCIHVSGLNAAGKGIAGAKSKLFFELPKAFSTIERVFGKRRTKRFVENVAGMPQDDIAMVTEVLGVKPYRIEAMDAGAVRRPRLYWLSWQLQARDDVIEIQEAEFYYKVKLHVAAEAAPAWAEDGWSLLDPSHVLPTFAQLYKRSSPQLRYVTQVCNFEDQNLLWNAARDKWRIPSAGERETLMGFDRGCTRAAVKDSLPGVEAEIFRSSLIGNSFSVQVVSYLFAQLLARVAGRAAPDIAPLLHAGAAPPSRGQEPEFGGAEVSDPDLERRLVFKYLRIASRGGADVRLDLQAPFRAKAWPRSGLQSNLWTRSIGHGFQRKQEAHINELEVGAAVNAVKWRARTTARFGTRYLHLLDSQVAASALAKGRSSARRLWG
ncbi:unnamed protein product [Prorocentrum cordatum]|uniref:Uncharacterized protein n=1 Tax=Prorocentrum cordatum TaxID=2364126 RepID=A0ABN9VVV8_9DINO|nr:unnamed protein product [Polarella glacialis]